MLHMLILSVVCGKVFARQVLEMQGAFCLIPAVISSAIATGGVSHFSIATLLAIFALRAPIIRIFIQHGSRLEWPSTLLGGLLDGVILFLPTWCGRDSAVYPSLEWDAEAHRFPKANGLPGSRSAQGPSIPLVERPFEWVSLLTLGITPSRNQVIFCPMHTQLAFLTWIILLC